VQHWRGYGDLRKKEKRAIADKELMKIKQVNQHQFVMCLFANTQPPVFALPPVHYY
jgi:hypothetical protein